jgi:hypothetical protein
MLSSIAGAFRSADAEQREHTTPSITAPQLGQTAISISSLLFG